MNAISPVADKTQAPEPANSDLDVLQRLIDLALQLAECAARQANAEASAQPAQAQTQPPGPRRADPNLVFLRLRRAIHETMVLKTRIAAGILPNAPRVLPRREPAPAVPAAGPAHPPNDPRATHIQRYFRQGIDITRKKRKPPITHQQIDDTINTELAKDPDQRLPGAAILLRICKALDLPFYATRMPTDLLRPPRALAIGPP